MKFEEIKKLLKIFKFRVIMVKFSVLDKSGQIY